MTSNLEKTMKKLKAKILENKKIGPDYFLMDLDSEYIVSHYRPGQFIHVRIEGNGSRPFLRRPFSIHSITGGDSFQILYKAIGSGTKILSHYKKGKNLDILGPLGNGFEVDPEKNSLLVAGGMGVAPLFSLAQCIKKTKSQVLTFSFLGARSKNNVLLESEFRRLGIKVLVCTEDGTCGKKGLVTQLLQEFLEQNPSFKKTSVIFGCGPNLMLKTLIKLAKNLNMDCQVSVEEIFACGVGACLGCAVNTRHGYKLACKDGPVFRGDDIIL